MSLRRLYLHLLIPMPVEPNSRFSNTSKTAGSPIFQWSLCDSIECFPLRFPNSCSASQSAICSETTASTTTAATQKRICVTSILLPWSVIFGANIVHDVLSCLRTWSRRQRLAVDDYCRCHFHGALRSIICRGCNFDFEIDIPKRLAWNSRISNTTATSG